MTNALTRRALAAFIAVILFAPAAFTADPPAAPKLKIPAEIKSDVGKWVRVIPDTDCKTITYVPHTPGMDPFPSEEQINKLRLIVHAGFEEKRYKFTAIGSLNDVHTTAEFEIIVGKPKDDGGAKPPPDADPPPVSPAPPSLSGKYYLVIPRADGPFDPGLQNALTLPGWRKIEEAGHTWKAIPLSQLPADVKAAIPDNGTIPCVFKLPMAKDGKTRGKADKPVPFPKSNEEVESLLNSLK